MRASALLPALAVGLWLAGAAAAAPGGRHELRIELDWSAVDTHSGIGAWTDGGFGKLRHDENTGSAESSRLALEYRGRLAETLFAHAVLDSIDDAARSIGLTEAYLEWRPLPRGSARQRFRFGAFYPAFSLENSEFAWASPYSRSFSAINAWLGEEIRPIGMDWRVSRTLGGPGSPHEIGASAGVFFGNDPAGTLLFWRGWSIHDRQTRLNERLPLPPLVFADPDGGADTIIARHLDPIAEIDDRPGILAGLEWTYARRAKLALGLYDNRADPYAFRDGQWGWGTRFVQLAGQIELPGGIGLVVQRMQGDTDWLTYTTSTGLTMPATEYVTDRFDSGFMLLSRPLAARQRVTLRFEEFDLYRPGLTVDRGNSVMIGYGLALNDRLDLQLEWLRIDSTRDLWPIFYDQPARDRSERLFQLGFRLVVLDSTR